MLEQKRAAWLAALEAEVVPGRERLAQWIERSKLTQLETARLIGMDPAQLSQILNGKRRPGLSTAVKIRKVTGIVEEDWVPVGEDDTIEPDAPAPGNVQMDKA